MATRLIDLGMEVYQRVIAGANRGGKSTCLRSVGLAQPMMRCGIFAPGQSFRANALRSSYVPGGARVGPFLGRWSRSGQEKSD